MAINKRSYERYDKALKKNAELAIRDIKKFIKAFDGDPDMLRDSMLDFYPSMVRRYGESAATVAMEFYDEQRSMSKVAGSYSSVMAAVPEDDVLRDNVRYHMGSYYENGDGDLLAENLGRSAQRHIMNAAEQTIVKNAKRDKAHPRWALVAHPGACQYCLMLSSRGFVYHEKDTVMASRHDGCTCTPVVDFDKRNPHLVGYDPNAIYDRWKHPEDYSDVPDNLVETVSRIKSFERAGSAKYIKQMNAFYGTDDERDLTAHAALLEHDHKLVILREDAPEGYSNIDLLVDGELYEVKSPTGSGKRIVEQNLRKAKRQFANKYGDPEDEIRVVFNGTNVDMEDSLISAEIDRQMKSHNIGKVIQVNKDGSILEH